MKIIVGLGNPGLRYRNTRHNAGFLAIKALSKKYKIPLRKKGFKGSYGTGKISGKEVMLFEPHTFMNLSGEAVKSLLSKLDDQKDLLIISDDFCLNLGTIRMKETGSAGGHNGLESIIKKIGVNFTRLRIGIGRDEEVLDASFYVLAPFSRKERKPLEEALQKAVNCAEIWLSRGAKIAMNQCNTQ